MSDQFGDCLTACFPKDSRPFQLLMGKYVVARIRAERAPCTDPFLMSIFSEDADCCIDATAVDSFWHITVHSQSPKKSVFRRLHRDDRDEERFHEHEIKVKASQPISESIIRMSRSFLNVVGFTLKLVHASGRVGCLGEL